MSNQTEREKLTLLINWLDFHRTMESISPAARLGYGAAMSMAIEFRNNSYDMMVKRMKLSFPEFWKTQQNKAPYWGESNENLAGHITYFVHQAEGASEKILTLPLPVKDWHKIVEALSRRA